MRSTKRKIAMSLLVTGLMTIGAGFTLAGTAAANPRFNQSLYDLHLKGDHHGDTWASALENDECDDARTTEQLPYAWHFVVPSYPVDGLPDVTAVYAYFTSAGAVTGGHVVQSGKGWYLYTATADVLEDAVGDSTATEASPVVMNLSHTCGPEGQSSSSAVTTTTGLVTTTTGLVTTTTQQATTTTALATTTTGLATTTTGLATTTTVAPTTTAVVGGIVITNSSPSSSASVQGVVLNRALPRTGFDPSLLLVLGGLLTVAGVLMLRYSDDTA